MSAFTPAVPITVSNIYIDVSTLGFHSFEKRHNLIHVLHELVDGYITQFVSSKVLEILRLKTLRHA